MIPNYLMKSKLNISHILSKRRCMELYVVILLSKVMDVVKH